MIRIYSTKSGKLETVSAEETVDREATWYDLLNPLPEERRAVEEALGISFPALEVMQEIEASSRLFQEDSILFMTTVVAAAADSDNPILSPIAFILTDHSLVTIRYVDPKPFQSHSKKIQKFPENYLKADSIFLGFLEAIVDRIADILEKIAEEVDSISNEIFKGKGISSRGSKHFHTVLVKIGRKGDLTTKARESLAGMRRLLAFFSQHLPPHEHNKKVLHRLGVVQRDVFSMIDQVSFLANKINFLLDATLGLINIEQNSIIKIFSVAAVIFLPPTLIASIYGMNFQKIPELQWHLGYPVALLLMVLSGVLPYAYFKRKGWL